MPAGGAETYRPGMSRIVRRLALHLPALLALALLTVIALVWWRYDAARLDLAGRTTFTNPVAVPPLAESRLDARGRRVFDLTLQRGETDFGHGRVAKTWGINQPYLGPTLRAQRGERVLVDVTNEVGEASTLHWHGMHLPARMDGGPHQIVEHGDAWSPTWEVDQPAATLWCHPHQHGSTADHVYRGLAGMFLVDDAESARLALPQEYGVDDIPLSVQDKRFDESGQLDDGTSFLNPVGVLGDEVLVNGTDDAYLPVTTDGGLVDLPDAQEAAAVAGVTRDLRLTTPTINGRRMDLDRIDATVEVGTTELWRVRNEDGTPHNFHVHDVQFRVVSVDGGEPEPALRGRKDTVLVPANTEVVLVMTFEDHTDPDAPYMFHCHLLRHEDQGMIGQFVVVERGEAAGDPGRLHDH